MKKILLLFVMIGITTSLSAQIKGTVVSNNQPVENAYVYNQTSKSHSHSNQLGQFEISNTNVGDILLVGLLGYEKQEITLTQDILNNLIIDLKPKAFMLDELVLSQPTDVLNSIVQIDLETNPINSSQEILRKVPGLIIGQHAGGGKAEQLFLRGFDIDHGTDVALSVDGMPVNMVSHAHGQGYSDLHFLIPETIEKIKP